MKLLPVVILVLPFALTGCWRFTDLAHVGPVTTETGDELIDVYTLPLPGTENPAYVAAAANLGARNFLQGAIINRSDEVCDRHKAAIHTNSAVFNVSTGFLTSMLSGAGAIVTNVTGANILSGAAALTNSTRSLVNEEVYQEMLAAAIIAEINENRSVYYEKIIARRAGLTSDYTVEDAIRDAIAYHQLCSFYEGVASIVKKAGVAQRSQADLVDASITKIRAQLAKDKTELADLGQQITTAAGEDALVEVLSRQRVVIIEKITRLQHRLSAMDALL